MELENYATAAMAALIARPESYIGAELGWDRRPLGRDSGPTHAEKLAADAFTIAQAMAAEAAKHRPADTGEAF